VKITDVAQYLICTATGRNFCKQLQPPSPPRRGCNLGLRPRAAMPSHCSGALQLGALTIVYDCGGALVGHAATQTSIYRVSPQGTAWSKSWHFSSSSSSSQLYSPLRKVGYRVGCPPWYCKYHSSASCTSSSVRGLIRI
jgi:hypothetical protein